MLARKGVGSIHNAGEELGWVAGYLGGTLGRLAIVQWLLLQETSRDSDLEFIYRSEPIFASRVGFLEPLPCSLSECSALFSL